MSQIIGNQAPAGLPHWPAPGVVPSCENASRLIMQQLQHIFLQSPLLHWLELSLPEACPVTTEPAARVRGKAWGVRMDLKSRKVLPAAIPLPALLQASLSSCSLRLIHHCATLKAAQHQGLGCAA